MNGRQFVVPGISVSPRGIVSVDRNMGNVLFGLAITLDGTSPHPVDVEHVLAAIILAWKAGELDSGTALSADDASLTSLLSQHLETVFHQYQGRLGQDD